MTAIEALAWAVIMMVILHLVICLLITASMASKAVPEIRQGVIDRGGRPPHPWQCFIGLWIVTAVLMPSEIYRSFWRM